MSAGAPLPLALVAALLPLAACSSGGEAAAGVAASVVVPPPSGSPADDELVARLDEQLATSHALRPDEIAALRDSGGPQLRRRLRATARDKAAPLHRRVRAVSLLGGILHDDDPLWFELLSDASPRELKVQAAWARGLRACRHRAPSSTDTCATAVGHWLAHPDDRVREVGVDLAHRRLARLGEVGRARARALLKERRALEADPAVRARIDKRLVDLVDEPRRSPSAQPEAPQARFR